MRWSIWITCLGLLTGCTVKYTYLQAGYKTDGEKTVKRLALIIEPRAVEIPALASAVGAMQREFLSVESTYILPPDPEPAVAAGGRASVCATAKNLDGVLVTEIRKVQKIEAKVLLEVRTVLYDCGGQRIWDSAAEASYKSKDSDRALLVRTYTARFGDPVGPYLIPMYEILRHLLVSLPHPKLSSDEERERIQNFRAPISAQKKS